MYNDTVDCPYCDFENDMSDALCDGIGDDNKIDWTCENCGEEFEVYIEFNPSYSASKIVYETCRDCGKEFRYEHKSYPKPQKYNNLSREEYIICDTCWYKATAKDYDIECESK